MLISMMRRAVALVEGLDFDRGYAAQEFYNCVVGQGMEPVIPPQQRAKGGKLE